MKKVSILIAFILASAVCFGQKGKAKDPIVKDSVQSKSVTIVLQDDQIEGLFFLLDKGKFDNVSNEEMTVRILFVQSLRRQIQAQLDARTKPK